MKIFKSLLTALLLLLCTIDAGAETVSFNGVYYSTDVLTNTASVTSRTGGYTGDVVILENFVYNGQNYVVTSIGYGAFSGNSGLTSVTLPNTITIIDTYAFQNCVALTEIVIPNSVTTIAGGAFNGCTALEDIAIPSSVKRIESSAFANTVWYNNQPDGLIYINDILYKYKGEMPQNTHIQVKNGVKFISSAAFYNCSGLVKITFPSSLTTIGSDAFNGCSNLENFVIPNTITSIESWAFANCTSLTSMAIPNSITKVEGRLFHGCTALTEVVIPEGATSLGAGLFSGCSSLKEIEIPNSVTEIGAQVFDETAWLNSQRDGVIYINDILYQYKGTMPEDIDVSITVKDGTVSISSMAFSNCAGLKNITIPNSVKSIGRYAFEDCTGLTSVTIGNSVTSIGKRAFYGCTGLTSITIPNSVTSIGSFAFRNCTALSNVTIPNSVETIGAQAFMGCDGLQNIIIPNSVTSIGEGAFSYCEGLASAEIPGSIKRIEEDLFGGCSNLKNVTIGGGVEFIGEAAFAHTNVENVELPNSVTTIENAAFAWCSNLKNVKIPNSVTTIGSHMFVGCEKLASITLPTSFTNIGGNMFKGCTGLTSIEIPKNITSIGNDAFLECTNLKTVYNYSDLKIAVGSEENGKVALYANEVLTYYPIAENEMWISNEKADYTTVNYKRKFSDTAWQPWYMPFDVELSDIENELEVACLNNVHQYDDNKDGEIDRTELEAISLVEGTLSANYPYIVRAKSTGTKNFVFDNVTIEPFENNSYDCSSLSTKFIFTGYNNAIDYNSSYYELENDCLAPVTNTVTKLTQLNNDKVYTLRSARAFLLYSSNLPDEICSSNGWSVGDVRRDINDVNQHFKIKSINGKYYLYSVAAGKYVNGDGEFVANATDALVVENVGGEYQWKLGVGNHVLNSQEWHRAASGMRVDDWTTTDEGNCYIIEEARTTLAPNRWYLSVEARNSMHKAPAQIRLYVRDEAATAVEEVEESCNDQDGAAVVYDLSGRRVETPTKGIYIVNGKKVVIK